MFEFAWAWVFLLAPLPWLVRALLPPADSGEAALKVSFISELEGLSGRRARVRLPALRQQLPFLLVWALLLLACARPHEIQLGILKRLRGTPIVRHSAEFGMVYASQPPYGIVETGAVDASTVQRFTRLAARQ